MNISHLDETVTRLQETKTAPTLVYKVTIRVGVFSHIVFRTTFQEVSTMKRTFSILLALAVLLSLAASEWLLRIGYGAHESVYADALPAASSRQLSDEEAVPPVDLQTQHNQPSQRPAAASASSQSSALLPKEDRLGERVPPSNPIVDEIRARFEHFASQYKKPGWLHTIDKVEHPNQQSTDGIAYKNIVIPPTFILEDWYHLDANLNVIESVTFMYDEKGQVVQVSVYKDGVWHNLTLHEDDPQEEKVHLVDRWFINGAAEVAGNSGQVFKSPVIVDNRSLVRYGYVDKFDPPILFHDLSAPVKAARKTIYFDDLNGRPVMEETIFTTVNGDEITTMRTTFQLIENTTTPPEEILHWLEEVK